MRTLIPCPKNFWSLSLQTWFGNPFKVMPATGWIFPLPWRLPSRPHRERRRFPPLSSWNGKLGICWMRDSIGLVLACFFSSRNLCDTGNPVILSTWRFLLSWFLLVMRTVFGFRNCRREKRTAHISRSTWRVGFSCRLLLSHRRSSERPSAAAKSSDNFEQQKPGLPMIATFWHPAISWDYWNVFFLREVMSPNSSWKTYKDKQNLK